MTKILATVAMIAVSVGLAAAQPANAAVSADQATRTGAYAAGGTGTGTYLGGN